MKRLLGVAVLSLLLGGCAGVTWVPRGDKNPSEFQVDHYQCQRESQVPWAASGLVWIVAAAATAHIQADMNYRSCMSARGYDQVKAK